MASAFFDVVDRDLEEAGETIPGCFEDTKIEVAVEETYGDAHTEGCFPRMREQKGNFLR